MAKNDTTTFVMRGKLMYPKVLGDPVLNYSEDGKEWKFDFVPNDPEGARRELKKVGVEDRIKSKKTYIDGADYITFKQKELRNDGTANDPIKIVDADQTPWDQDELIGNETVADVKFVVVDFGKGKYKGMYPRSIRILDHVPYRKGEFEALDENDEFYVKAKEKAEARKATKTKDMEEFRKDFDVTWAGALDDELDDEMPI